jgi:3-hydroxy-D-aspartate aldolase
VSDDLRLHGSLVGTPARGRLNTPALIVDRDALDRNIARMADCARTRGVALRPHAKTHKSVDIARRQIAAGAIGMCCAKLGEAEALAAGGIGDILITSPVVSGPAIRRLVELHRRTDDLMVVIDHPDNAAALAAALDSTAGPTDRPLGVLVDIDPGIRRTGVASAAAALELAQHIARLDRLAYRGVQMYCGVQQHIASFHDREAAIRDRTAYLETILAVLSQNHAAPAIVTGSGTGTHRIDGALGLYTEWQVGSYIFMDRQYAECDLTGDGAAAPFDYALFVDARVISCNAPGMATIDAGFKALATDGGPPVILDGAPAGSTYRFMGDEHGAIIDPAGKHTWRLGDPVRLAAPHCDPTVNLYDSYHVFAGDTLDAIWPVSARGRSR